MLVVPMITGPDPKVDPKVPGTIFVHKDRNNPFQPRRGLRAVF